MRYILVLILACILPFYSCNSNGKQDDNIPDENKPYTLAYLPTWKMPYTPDWEKITHLCIAFGLVQSDGSLDLTEVNKYRSIINLAQSNRVKVLLSIGGGGTTNFSAAILTKNKRDFLIENLEKTLKDYGFDGIDVDYEEWEGGPGGYGISDSAKREALEQLYKELRAKVGKEKLITAAVSADWNDGKWGFYNCYNNTMHQYLDFVSLMIYDETGPWESSQVGQHASWEFFENSINFWLNERELPKEKLLAGLPFYGYRFKSEDTSKDAEGMSYKDILINYPDVDAHLSDNVGLLFYNGMLTVKRKADYIKNNQLGGVMFWEISQDSDDKDKSLLGLIYKSFTNKE